MTRIVIVLAFFGIVGYSFWDTLPQKEVQQTLDRGGRIDRLYKELGGK